MKLKLNRSLAASVSSIALCSALTVSTATAATTHTSVAMQDQRIYASVERVTVVELQKLIAEGKAVVVDVRLPEQYAAGHIKGARSIPLMDMEARAAELPRDKQIVTYCA